MASDPTRAEIDAQQGPVVIEFGASWCPHCIGAQPLIAAALVNHAGVRHLKIEDGKGQPLGRSFRVKLWPTLIFLKDGKEAGRLVRPANSNVISQELSQIDSGLAPERPGPNP